MSRIWRSCSASASSCSKPIGPTGTLRPRTRSDCFITDRSIQVPHVDIAVPDLTTTFELQRQDPLQRTAGGIVIDRYGDHLTVEHVNERVASRDDLHLLPLPCQSAVRFHRSGGIPVHDADAVLLTGNKFHQTTWRVHDPAALALI